MGEFSLICCTSMAHAGNTKIWAKVISGYAKKCSTDRVFVAEGRREGKKRKYICTLGA